MKLMMRDPLLVKNDLCSVYEMFVSILQADFLEPHLHGVVAFFNFMLVRLDFFENNAKGRLVHLSCGIVFLCE